MEPEGLLLCSLDHGTGGLRLVEIIPNSYIYFLKIHINSNILSMPRFCQVIPSLEGKLVHFYMHLSSTWCIKYVPLISIFFEEQDQKNRLRWCGHVPMDPQRTVQKVPNYKPYGSRRFGRSKLRWQDEVLQDIRALNMNWRDTVVRREEWQRLLRKVKAHPRAVEPVMMMIIYLLLWLIFRCYQRLEYTV